LPRSAQTQKPQPSQLPYSIRVSIEVRSMSAEITP